MKNYKVIATREFKDSNEIDENTGLKKERKVNDEFYCAIYNRLGKPLKVSQIFHRLNFCIYPLYHQLHYIIFANGCQLPTHTT